jgi:type IV secretory pathway VirJ component
MLSFLLAIGLLAGFAPPPANPGTRLSPQTDNSTLESALRKLGLSFEFRLPADPQAFVIFLSGDGGWASTDRNVSDRLADHGIGVVGLSSLDYFWHKRKPEQVAADLGRIIGVLASAGRPIFAGGYSFGAEVVPVVLPQVPPADRRALDGLVLLAPGMSASFEVNMLDWIRTPKPDPGTLVTPAIRAAALPVICIDGAKEAHSGCTGAKGAPHVDVVQLPGGHHLGEYDAVAQAIIAFVDAYRVHPSALR